MDYNERSIALEVKPTGSCGKYEILVFTYNKNGEAVPSDFLLIDDDNGETTELRTNEKGIIRPKSNSMNGIKSIHSNY